MWIEYVPASDECYMLHVTYTKLHVVMTSHLLHLHCVQKKTTYYVYENFSHYRRRNAVSEYLKTVLFRRWNIMVT